MRINVCIVSRRSQANNFSLVAPFQKTPYQLQDSVSRYFMTQYFHTKSLFSSTYLFAQCRGAHNCGWRKAPRKEERNQDERGRYVMCKLMSYAVRLIAMLLSQSAAWRGTLSHECGNHMTTRVGNFVVVVVSTDH